MKDFTSRDFEMLYMPALTADTTSHYYKHYIIVKIAQKKKSDIEFPNPISLSLLPMGYEKDILAVFAYEFEPSHALSFYTAL